jgi:basic membrane protein A and related proteins
MRSKWGKLLAVFLAMTMVASLAIGCGGNGGDGTAEEPGTGEPTTDVKAAMVTDIGGLGDKSFNDLSYAGLQRAESELGVEVQVVESREATDYENNITQLINSGFDPIFAVGFLMTDTVNKMAPQFPDALFGGIDIFFEDPPANVVGLNFAEHEAAYLAGVVAGMLTTMPEVDDRLNDRKVIGFVGGMEIPPVQRFEVGFKAGVESVDPSIEVRSIYTGSFVDQQDGIEAANNLIGAGADIIFAAAGQTGTGSFTACQDQGALFIGVDADQYETLDNPGDTIITSAIKRVDSAVFQVVQGAVDGTLQGGQNIFFGLAEDGVGIAPFHEWDDKMPQAVRDAVEQARTDIVSGAVTVPAE